MIPSGVFIVLIFLFGLLSKRLERTAITGPMVFATAGIVVALVLPDQAAVDVKNPAVVLFTEIALAVMLFTAGAHIPLRALVGSASLAGRLLGIGLPLAILAGAVAAALLLPGLGVWEAAILAVILAATDVDVAHVAVSSHRVPLRIREALNVESGLNDAIVLPLLLLFVMLAQADQVAYQSFRVVHLLESGGLGLLAGLIVGWCGGWLMHYASVRGWMTEVFQQIGLLTLALVAFGAATATGGSGMIGAFVAGLAVKVSFGEAGEAMLEFSEAWGQLLDYGVFFLFGMLAAPDLSQYSAPVLLYAILSLTVVRLIPVALALVRTRLAPATVLFMGWFGPRGLASIVLGLFFLEQEAHLPGQPLIEIAITATVLLSIFAHGISAAPLTRLYARRIESVDADAPELAEVAGTVA